jgi:hypothetical protein
MSWFDIFLLASLAAFVALGAKRKLTGLLVGILSIPLFRVLLTFADNGTSGIIVAVVMAVLAGVLFGMLGRSSVFKGRGLELPLSIAGGVGGLLTGLLLVGALITSFPVSLSYDKASVYYPSQETPKLLIDAANGSQIFGLGRSIVLLDLLDKTSLSTSQQGIYSALNGFFAVGQPWEKSN